MKQRKKFDSEFKKEAIKLLIESGKSSVEIAENLGVNQANLLRWKREYENHPEIAFPGNGNQSRQDLEIKKLQRQLADIKMERDILKKAMAIFCQPQK